MKRELEWRNTQGVDILCDETGLVIATVRLTHERLWKTQYGADPALMYTKRDEARRAMMKRDEEAQQKLLNEAKKKPKEEVKGAGKNS